MAVAQMARGEVEPCKDVLSTPPEHRLSEPVGTTYQRWRLERDDQELNTAALRRLRLTRLVKR